MPVAMRRVLAKDSPRVIRSYDQDPVEQLTAPCPGEALADRVRPRCAWWRSDDLDGVGFEYRVEHRGVFRVPVPDQESQLLQPLAEVHRQVPGLLGDPSAGRVRGHAGDMQFPGRMLDEDQHVQAAEQHRVDVQEVTGDYPGAPVPTGTH